MGITAGTISDRIDRRTLLRGIEVTLAITFSLFAALIALDLISLWHVYALTFLSGSAFALYFPIRAAYAYDLTGGKRVVSGLGLLHGGWRMGEFVGALATGGLVARIGTDVACLALAVAPCCAYFVLRGLRTPGAAAGARSEGLRDNLREYAEEVRRNRTLVALVLITVGVEIFAFSNWTALPELVTRRLAMDAEGLGILHAARALGGLALALNGAALLVVATLTLTLVPRLRQL
jgi:MFS family permease